MIKPIAVSNLLIGNLIAMGMPGFFGNKYFLLMSKLVLIVFSLMFIIGILLLILALIGFFVPVRNPQVYNYYENPIVNTNTSINVELTYKEALKQIEKLPGENDELYIYRLTNVVHKSISPYWDDEGIDTFYMRIPIWENYILWAYSYINPKIYLRYQINDYKRAIERGIGLCSQYSIVESSILEKNGIDTKIVGLSGHVIITAQTDDKSYVIDPQHNIVIPHSLEEVEENPEITLAYYKYAFAPEYISSLYTTTENNKELDDARSYTGFDVYDFEYRAYSLIWLIPVYLIMPFTLVQVTLRLKKCKQFS